MGIVRLFHVVTKAKPSKPGLFLINTQAIAASWDAHQGTYQGSSVDLATFKAKVADLATWQQAVRNRTAGAVVKRNEAVRALAALVEQFRAFVEMLCAQSPEQAASLAQNAGMYLSSTAVRAKVPLRARQGDQPGVVKLYASVALLVIGKGGRYFVWEYSIDGGATWLSAPSTPKSRTVISGLPVLKTAMFRVSVYTNKAGQGPWTDAISFLVH